MSDLKRIVQEWHARPGVTAALLLGHDGLPIEADTDVGVETEHLAALIAPLLAAARTVAEAANLDRISQILVEGETGTLLVDALTPDALLAVLADETADLGGLLFEIRRYRGVVGALL